MHRIVRRSRRVLAVVVLCSLALAPSAFAANTGESPFRRFIRRLIVRVFDDTLSVPPGLLIP